jgi:nondiscriminating aspartyl-tRNA synthetase
MYIIDVLKSKENIKLRGWVQELRDLGKVKFIVLRDKTGILQIVVKGEEISFSFKELSKEDYVEISGKLIDSKQAPNGKELIPDAIKVISKSEQPTPIDLSEKIETGLDKRIDWRFLDMRKPKSIAIFQLQSELIKNMVDFMHSKGFTRIFSSKIVGSPTEGGTEYFPIVYFDREAFLAQSPQFYKELSLMSGLDRVYEIGMVYRAEPHHTSRHLCEYVSFDYEMVADTMEEIMSMEEELLRHTFEKIKKDCKNILELYNIKLEFPKSIPRVHFNDAVKIVEKMGVKTEPGDLTPAGERALSEWTKKEKKSDFVFLYGFPWKHKVFYAKKMPNGDAESFDLLYKGLEITSGGRREENAIMRIKNMKEKGLKPEQFDHLRFFKYSVPPHGGLAIGIERFTQLILNLENIREASLTPRDPTRLTP